MYLMDLFAENEFQINFNEEIIYGTDNPWGDENWVPTVELELYSTPGLIRLADCLRVRRGFRPINPVDGLATKDQLDHEAWYNFYVTLSKWGDNPLDHDLCFTVNNSSCEDDGEMYQIELSPDDRKRILRILDRQCRHQLGDNCDDLLLQAEAIARTDMSRHA